ncbi:MAG: hypothetical protein CMJ18_19830 [Phycisphaeraceae bacterium]|nr:hypothetical protein [Phycisphaeraceae bacterium]
MEADLKRVMLLVKDVPALAAFYRDCLGCSIMGDIDSEWTEVDAGGCAIALHRWDTTQSERGHPGVKIVFGVADVAAVREELVGRGVRMGEVHRSRSPRYEGLEICDGYDPEGNWFQISNRGITACLAKGSSSEHAGQAVDDPPG